MIKAISIFVILAALIFLVIQGFQKLTGKEALALTKVAGYATISSAVAIALLFIFVELF